MAWTSMSDRFGSPESKLHKSSGSLGPGSYIGQSSFEASPSYAPFGSMCTRAVGSKDPADMDLPRAVSPPPGAYDPKLPKAYDSGLPKKTVPFSTGAPRDCDRPSKDAHPGPGAYNVLPKAKEVLPCRTMGFPPSEQRLVMRSLSAPSIPRGHQCFGYEETGDGRLVRQNPKDGSQWLSGRAGDSAGPGHYDYEVANMVRRPVGGKILPEHSGPQRKDETPGPGHYVAKVVKQPTVSSSFVSTSDRLKPEPKVSELPGPGQYEPRRHRASLRELHPELQYFGSTAERFKEAPSSSTPGPGFYADLKSRKAPPRPSFGAAGRFQESVSQGSPGPGHYDTSGERVMGGPYGSVSILGSTGSLAFGSMESRRFNTSMSEPSVPGPGAYNWSAEGSDDDKRRRRPLKPPSSVFKSETPKDFMVRQAVKDGQQRPPPGAYSPVHAKDVAAVVRLPKKAEGFLSCMPRSTDAVKPPEAPGPGKYQPSEITGGKRAGSFNRAVLEGTTGLGFESQSRRFSSTKATKAPGPGEYQTMPSWTSRTFNVHFGEVA